MIYDFKCTHDHLFEHTCKMDDRLNEIPCEGMVNQIVEDELYDKHENGEVPLPDDLFWMSIGIEEGEELKEVPLGEKVLMRKVSCRLKASIHVGGHNNPRNLLDHGLSRNRDAAREGRYDPLNPSVRFMSKGRGWRK